jgi:hypothetical protein
MTPGMMRDNWLTTPTVLKRIDVHKYKPLMVGCGALLSGNWVVLRFDWSYGDGRIDFIYKADELLSVV